MLACYEASILGNEYTSGLSKRDTKLLEQPVQPIPVHPSNANLTASDYHAGSAFG